MFNFVTIKNFGLTVLHHGTRSLRAPRNNSIRCVSSLLNYTDDPGFRPLNVFVIFVIASSTGKRSIELAP
jgi:hypothetical protein